MLALGLRLESYSVDPLSAFPLSMWLEDYVGGTWVGKASGGTSGSVSAAPGVAPSVGTSINGHGTALFAPGQYLNAGLLSGICNAASWSAGMLINASFTAFDQLLLMLAFDPSFNAFEIGIQGATTRYAGIVYQQTGGKFTDTNYTPGVTALVQAKYDGTTCFARLNAGARVNRVRPVFGAPLLASTVQLGGTGINSVGRLASVYCSKTLFSDSQEDTILARYRTWSGEALT